MLPEDTNGPTREEQLRRQPGVEDKAMNNEGNKYELSGVFIGLGVLLMVLGALFFVGQAAGFELGRIG
jgi:hypothetical protein